MSGEATDTTVYVPVVLTREQATMVFNACRLAFDAFPVTQKRLAAPLAQAMVELADKLDASREQAA